MGAYILRRLLLMVPTLFGILLLNFLVVQLAPGGPVEQLIAQMEGHGDFDAVSRIGKGSQGEVAMGQTSRYQGAKGLDPELIQDIERAYGFDKPPHERFWILLNNYLRFDLGESFFRDRSVLELIQEKLPVSISLGLWTTLITYLISIPMGIRKATQDGSPFDVWTSAIIVVGHAIPGFMFGILLIVLFAGGSFFDWFPLRGLVSDGWQDMAWGQRILDYFWHMALPILALVVGSFASLTMLTKNSFLDEIHKQYVTTARAKGLKESRILYGHVFRNAMLIVVAGFPATLIHVLFTGALLIEVIFSLDGLGLLGFEAIVNRDYPVFFGTLYVFTLLGLVLKLVGDLMYMVIDPRIDFENRGG